MTRHLFVFCLLVFVFSCLAGLPQPKTAELRYVVQVLLGWIYNDSSFYMDKAWEVVKAGKPLYQTLFFEEHYKFIYPPSSLLTYAIAEKVHMNGWRLIELMDVLSLPATLVVAGEIFLFMSPPAPDERRGKLYRRLLIAALGLLFYPLISSTSTGQIQTFLTFLWTLAVYCWLKQRRARAGVYIALACVFKPMLAVFLVWGVVRRQGRFVAGFSAAMIVIETISVAVFGWRDQVDYLKVLAYLSRRGEAVVPNQTVNGLLHHLLHNGGLVWSRTEYPPYNHTIYLGTLISSLVLFAFGLVFPARRPWKGNAQDFILFGMIATMASPIAWDFHYSYFFAGIVYLLALHLRPVTRTSYVLAACFLLMANSWQYLYGLATTRWSPLLSYDLYAGLTMVLLMAFTAHQKQETGWMPNRRGTAAGGVPG